MTSLDLGTVLILHGTSLIAGAGTLLFVWPRAGRPPGLATIAIAFITLAAGAFLAGLGQIGAIPHSVWRDSSAALGAGSYVLFLLGVCTLDRDADHLRCLLGLPVVMLVVGFVTPVFANDAMRSIVFHATAALANLAAGLSVAAGRRAEPLPSRFPLISVLMACGLVYGAQIPLLVTGRSTPGLVSSGLAVTMMLNFAIAALLVSFARERREETHRRASDADILTGILNRRGFLRIVPDTIAPGGALAVFDLDHFKAINDRHGHAAGDQALIGFAHLIESHLHAGEVVARTGGEEFVVYLPKAADAAGRIERIRAATPAMDVRWTGERITLSTSVGLAVGSGDIPHRRDALLSRADAALYRAKAGGRNRVAIAGPDEDRASYRSTGGLRSSATLLPAPLAAVSTMDG